MKTATATDANDVKQVVRAHWDRRAPTFDEGASHGLHDAKQEQAWRVLMKQVAGPTPLDVLDIGCGTGFLALLLADAGCRATGIDMSEEMLGRARGKATAQGLPVTFKIGDAEAPPFAPGGFDLIVERHVIWTLPHPARALAAWRELLRPGGCVVLIEGDWDMTIKNEYLGIHQALPLFGGVPSAQLSALAADNGYADVAAQPLMDDALWLETPKHPRYLVIGKRAG